MPCRAITATMSRATKQVFALCEAYGQHMGVTHWAISMRILGKGDFFHRLDQRSRTGKIGRMEVGTYERVLDWFSDNWPTDLEWPEDIPRPSVAKAVTEGGK